MLWKALASACIIGFASSANYTNHAPMIEALTTYFGFSLAAAGLLTTGIFLSHGGIQITGGSISDRFGPRRLMPVALAIVTAGNVALGLSTSYWQLLAWKIFVGLGTGTCFVAGARYITSMFAGSRLHAAQGFYGGSVLLGSGFVVFAVPLLLARLGWRGVFFFSAALAAAAGLVWILLASEPPLVQRKPAPLARMLHNPQLWLLGLAQMASFGLVIVVGGWVTAYLSSSFHLSLQRAGRIGSAVLVIGIVSRPLGGLLLPKFGHKLTIRTGLVLNATACLIFASGSASLARASIGVILLGLGGGLPYAAVFNRAGALYPDRAGAAMGLVNMLGILMILAAPPLIGQMVEWSKSFTYSFWALATFTVIALVGTLAIYKEPAVVQK
jgi:nitrate/nitrite transporter NarK